MFWTRDTSRNFKTSVLEAWIWRPRFKSIFKSHSMFLCHQSYHTTCPKEKKSLPATSCGNGRNVNRLWLWLVNTVSRLYPQWKSLERFPPCAREDFVQRSNSSSVQDDENERIYCKCLLYHLEATGLQVSAVWVSIQGPFLQVFHHFLSAQFPSDLLVSKGLYNHKI